MDSLGPRVTSRVYLGACLIIFCFCETNFDGGNLAHSAQVSIPLTCVLPHVPTASAFDPPVSLTLDWATFFGLRTLLDGLDLTDSCAYDNAVCECACRVLFRIAPGIMMPRRRIANV